MIGIQVVSVSVSKRTGAPGSPGIKLRWSVSTVHAPNAVRLWHNYRKLSARSFWSRSNSAWSSITRSWPKNFRQTISHKGDVNYRQLKLTNHPKNR